MSHFEIDHYLIVLKTKKEVSAKNENRRWSAQTSCQCNYDESLFCVRKYRHCMFSPQETQDPSGCRSPLAVKFDDE